MSSVGLDAGGTTAAGTADAVSPVHDYGDRGDTGEEVGGTTPLVRPPPAVRRPA